MVDEVLTDKVMRACTRNAKKVAKTNRDYVSEHDIMGEMFVWVLENHKLVSEWMDEGHKGMGKLNTTLFRTGHRYVNVQRAEANGGNLSDLYWYTIPVVEDLLEDVWDYIDWLPTRSLEHERGSSSPSEGNNRTAMLADVAFAVSGLSKEDQELLRDRYANGGAYIDAIAAKLELTNDGVRKRIDRVLKKLIDKLGGEPPYWNGGRRRKPKHQDPETDSDSSV